MLGGGGTGPTSQGPPWVMGGTGTPPRDTGGGIETPPPFYEMGGGPWRPPPNVWGVQWEPHRDPQIRRGGVKEAPPHPPPAYEGELFIFINRYFCKKH